jgi:insulysin
LTGRADPLDKLAAMVAEKFAPAQNQNLPPPLFEGSPYTPKELQQGIFVKTVKDTRLLELTFPFPDQDALFETKPGQFLSHFIGHEGPGSILSYLRTKGWANSLSAGASPCAAGFALFKINVELTRDGLANYQAAAQVIFNYLKLLKSTPPQEWAFQEVAMLSEMAFRFQDKSQPISYVTTISSWMQKPYPRDLVLAAPYLSSDFNKEQIAGAMSHLDVGNCRVTVASQQPIDGLTYDSKERWYGTQYTIKSLSEDFVKVRSRRERPTLAELRTVSENTSGSGRARSAR